MSKGPSKGDRNKKARQVLTAKQIMNKREFLGVQKNYRNAAQMRLFKGAELMAIKEELAKFEADKDYKTNWLYQGSYPYTEKMLAVYHDEILYAYIDFMESEEKLKRRLLDDYGMEEKQLSNLFKGGSKNFVAEPPKIPMDEKVDTEDYFG